MGRSYRCSEARYLATEEFLRAVSKYWTSFWSPVSKNGPRSEARFLNTEPRSEARFFKYWTSFWSRVSKYWTSLWIQVSEDETHNAESNDCLNVRLTGKCLHTLVVLDAKWGILGGRVIICSRKSVLIYTTFVSFSNVSICLKITLGYQIIHIDFRRSKELPNLVKRDSSKG